MIKFRLFSVSVLVLCSFQIALSANEAAEIARIFSTCHKRSPEFDACMTKSLNKLRPYFKIGIPELGVAPFDPQYAHEIRHTRQIGGIFYTLTLRDVYSYGYTQSLVTKYMTDWENERIVFSQFFPEKWLNGEYDFKGDIFGGQVHWDGYFNLTLREYSQTTQIKRSGEGVDVRMESGHFGDADVHVSNLSKFLHGNQELEVILDRIIKTSLKPALPLFRPIIDDLLSTAFTDIWSHSFRNFPIDNFIK